MMQSITKVVAFDDDSTALESLVTGLNRAGIASIGVQFKDDHEAMGIVPTPYVRTVFMDVNLLAIPQFDDTQNVAAIAALLETIAPAGPYLLVLWTVTPSAVEKVRDYLDERLIVAAKPFDVVPLAKASYISRTGELTDRDGLIEAVKGLIDTTPSLATLTCWEEEVFTAAAKTLASITTLGGATSTGVQQQADIPRIMYAMAKAAVGVNNIRPHGFRAVHDALLPILADRIIASSAMSTHNETWRKSIDSFQGGMQMSPTEAALLNQALHIAIAVEGIDDNKGAERGAVIPFDHAISAPWAQTILGTDEKQAAKDLFRIKALEAEKPYPWVLVQAQASCDYAQRQPGPLPFYLGLDVIQDDIRRDRAPQALWRSPRFMFEGAIHELQVNTRIQVPMGFQEAQSVTPRYRLREQLVIQLLHHAQSNNARPGIIAFQ